MADFCHECSIELFGEDFRELADITTEDDMAQGLSAVVICESCGVIQVDPDGKRIGPKPPREPETTFVETLDESPDLS